MISTRKQFIYCVCSISFLFVLLQLFQVPYLFEEGMYLRYTLSIIQDFDLNIFNQFTSPDFKWLATETYNHPDFERSAVSVLLSPFFIYQIGLSKIFSSIKASQINDFLPSYIFAVVFYVSIAFSLLYKICVFLKLKHIKKSFFFYAAATPFLWYFVFTSTNTNIFALFYSIIALLFFVDDKDENGKPDLLVGLCAGFGFVLRIQLIWIVAYPIYRLIKTRKVSYSSLLLFLVGFIFPVSLMFVNNYIQFGDITNPLSAYYSHYWSTDFLFSNLAKNSFGPNGYFQVSPIYLVLLPALILAYKVKHSELKHILRLAFIPIIALFFFYNSLWPVMDGVIGRHLLSYFFFFTMLLSLLFTYTQSKSKWCYYFLILFLSVSVILFAITISRIIYFDFNGQFWKLLLESFNFNFLFKQDISIIENITSVNKLKNSLTYLLYFSPLLLLGGYALNKVLIFASLKSLTKIKGITKNYIIFTITIYFLFTSLNIVFNKKNIITNKNNGLYDSVVIANDKIAFVFDDFSEVYSNTVRYYYSINDCKRVTTLNKLYQNYLIRVKQSIIVDPTDFKTKLENDLSLKSNIENQEANKYLKDLVGSKCLL